MNIRNIAVFGGVHGNEFIGVFLVRKLQKYLAETGWDGLNIKTFLGNPEAYEKGVRYIDSDLNRSFRMKDLSDSQLPGYEAARAKAINMEIGPKDTPKTDFIVDIHTSTANVGITIILIDDNYYNFKLAAYLQKKLPNIFIYYIPPKSKETNADIPYLKSLAPYGLGLEVGPVPNCVVIHTLFDQTWTAFTMGLDYICMTNSGREPELIGEVEVFRLKKSVNFPLDDEGNIDAVVHEKLQNTDYQPLCKGDPIFMTLSGKTVTFEENDEFYPIFVNEAAYYPQHTAFSLTEKIYVDVEKGL